MYFEKRCVRKVGMLTFGIVCCLLSQSQNTNREVYQTSVAGAEYKASNLYKKLWGIHYRKEWLTAISAPILSMDTVFGGLKPYRVNIQGISNTIQLYDKARNEYVMTSVDKRLGRLLPPIYHQSFIEDIINDQSAALHPYAALTIAPMAEAAKIYHHSSKLVFVPSQNSLDSFITRLDNTYYWLEEESLKNDKATEYKDPSTNTINTEALVKNIQVDENNRADQLLFVRSRLFDFFIGDWDRSENSWQWWPTKQKDKTVYEPVPINHDEAYSKFDGFLVKALKGFVELGYIQTFDNKIKDIRTFNYPARHLDRLLTNETTLEQWRQTAQELQAALTDSVISSGIKAMPPSVVALSGEELIHKLKNRRNDLYNYATAYYLFLAKEVAIPGSKNADHFKITGLPDGVVCVEIFDDKMNSQPFYTRSFSPAQTKEIYLYGLGGNDWFEVIGQRSPITVRIIGGAQKDSYQFNSAIKPYVYDDRSEVIEKGAKAHVHLSNDSTVHQFKYDAYQYSHKGLSPIAFYNNDDRIYVGLAYNILRQQWRKQPYGQKHSFYTHFSVSQKAFSFGYAGIYNQVAGNWRAVILANYDLIKWQNFFGLGNKTIKESSNADYYRLRTTEGLVGISLEHGIGRQSSVAINPFYQYIKILKDGDRYLSRQFVNNTGAPVFTSKNFGGIAARLLLRKTNNYLLPTRGIEVSSDITAQKNLAEEKSFISYSVNIRTYIPLSRHIVLSLQNGGATVSGQPEFYQLNTIGATSLRGYRGDRFYGETVFHSNNELQYLFNVRSHWYNGAMGVVSFADAGRVWKQGELSNQWHYGFGGGLIAVPFNQLYISILYGQSKEYGSFYVTVRKALRNR